jgi:hypothetical protein
MNDPLARPPRLFGIPAADAPVVAVLRRGPSDWTQVLAWWPDEARVERGAWLRGKLFPQRCDLSPDGRYLAYVAQKYPPRPDWEGGDTYAAVSRLPWLTALVVWASSAWDYGDHFVPRGAGNGAERSPRLPRGIARRWDLAPTSTVQFAVEHLRGWKESADTPPRERGGWDEARVVHMEKRRPGHGERLRVGGRYAAWRASEPTDERVSYRIVGSGVDLGGVQWADWHAAGDLLVATRVGTLERWSGPELQERAVHADLADDRPDPQPAPGWAGAP